ncbi:hypothetical protein PIB30_058300 [Stylosanthes scabra]|uniref:Ubiquitin-like protease family profile domain-containing protein n=1 Tax=Stylosanthes scabra TaxID=79078 RepID=A0ABU6QKL8_9FABA|nr:hypothetical protein [Stylosanthes scabra]
MFIYLKDHPDKRALVDEMGFGVLSYLPDKYLNQKLLKQIYDHYDIYDNTIYSDAAAVNITTEKIRHALGLSSKGTPYDIKVDKKKLSQEDSDVHKFFQGITTVFLLPNSTAKITPVALPTIFDLENTRNRNWAHHVHNFLLQELKKAKQKKSVVIHGCCYALMIIYFHETQFGEKSRDPAAQPPWLAYWTGKMRAEKEQLKKKSTKRVLSSDSESQIDSESQNSSSIDGEGDSESKSQQQERRSKKKEDRRMASSSSSDSEETISEEPPQQEIRIKQSNDRVVIGSNSPFNPTQQTAAVAGLSQSDDATLADSLKNIRKRKKQQIEDRNTKKRIIQGNEGGEKIQDVRRSASEAANGSSNRTRMFDSFETVSLGKDDSDNVVVEGSSIMPSQPSQTEKDVLQVGPEGEVPPVADVPPEAEVQPEVENVVEKEQQPEPIVVEMPLQPDQPSKTQYAEVEDPVPINIEIPLKTQEHCSLALRPWLQPEAETSTAVESPEVVITNVLLSMNRKESYLGGDRTQPAHDDNQEQQLGAQCKTPDSLQQQYQNAPTKQDLEERCATWATVENDNKYETIFQLMGPKTIEAMRYNFLTMTPETCIDIQMVSLMWHILNREELPRFERYAYCVPPEILDHQEYMELLDRDKLKSHSALFAPVVYSNHWWLYVLDVDIKEFYIVDSV